MAAPLIVAAGLDPQERRCRPARRSVDQRLRRGRAGGLSQYRADRRGGQRQRGPGRDRARAGPRHRRPCRSAPAGRRRRPGSRLHQPAAGRRRRRGGRGRCGDGLSWRGAEAALGKLPGVQPHPGIDRRRRGRAATSSKAGITGKGCVEFFKKLQNLEYRYGYDSRSPDAQFYSLAPLVGRPHHHADRHLRTGSGLEPPVRSRDRAALPAGQGQALRLYRRAQADRCRPIPNT